MIERKKCLKTTIRQKQEIDSLAALLKPAGPALQMTHNNNNNNCVAFYCADDHYENRHYFYPINPIRVCSALICIHQQKMCSNIIVDRSLTVTKKLYDTLL